jgi:hypothetical protein
MRKSIKRPETSLGQDIPFIRGVGKENVKEDNEFPMLYRNKLFKRD